MSVVSATKQMSAEEYLLFEEAAAEKHEFYQGEVFATAGATIEHNQIVRNALTAIDSYLRDKNCQVFPSHLKVHIESNSLFTYPDLSIVCGELQRHNNRTI